MKINVLFSTMAMAGAALSAAAGATVYLGMNPTPPPNKQVPCEVNAEQVSGLAGETGVGDPTPQNPPEFACNASQEIQAACMTACINVPAASYKRVALSEEPCTDPLHPDCKPVTCVQWNYTAQGCNLVDKGPDSYIPGKACL